MTKEELKKIMDDQPNLKNIPNSVLISYMDLLSNEFEIIKKNIIESTIHLDNIELLYNNILKTYSERTNG